GESRRLAPGEDEERAEDARQRQPGRAVDGRGEPVVREVAGDRGADEEADAEGDADHRERARAVLGRGIVGDVRLGKAEVASRRSVDDARQVKDPEGLRARHDQEPDEGPDLADEEHRPPADGVGDPAEERARHELTGSVRRDEERGLERRGPEVLSVDAEERNDEREAEDVDEDDEKDREERLQGPATCTPVRWPWRLDSPVPRSWTGPSRPVGGTRFAALRRASWRRLRRRRPLGSVLAYHAAHGEEDREEDQAQEACVQGRDRGREQEGQRGRRGREEGGAKGREEGSAKGREEGGRTPEGAAAEEGQAGGSETSGGRRGQEGRAAHRAEGGAGHL